MIFQALALAGAYIIEIAKMGDERGFFARSYCTDVFLAHGLEPVREQCDISYNMRHGTVRGMHYQEQPHAEAKLVRCTRGALFDVIIDVRPESPTYCKWVATSLTADNYRMLYVPRGCAHGFQTLEDHSEVFYQVSHPYSPQHARGVRWDDPLFSIQWPLPVTSISEKDRSYADFLK
jgi:dTDP-4-dehydrorhamnose 3,5-epimerase